MNIYESELDDVAACQDVIIFGEKLVNVISLGFR